MKKLVLLSVLGGLALVFGVPSFAGEGLSVRLSIEPDQVRFTAQGAQEMRVEVFGLTGQRLFDSGALNCSSLSWNKLSYEGRRVASGVYLYVVTVRNSEGKLVRKLGKLALLGSSGRQTLVSFPTSGPQATQSANGLCLARVSQNSAEALIVQALADPQVQQLQQQLESQGLRPNLNAAKVFSGAQNVVISIPFNPQGEILYFRTPQGSNATAVTSQGRRRDYRQASGATSSLLSLNPDQIRGVLQQAADFLKQRGITKGWASAGIDETRREVWLIISTRTGNQVVILEARSWSESGEVIVGSVKQGPMRSSCGSQMGTSSQPRTRLVPLAQQVCFTFSSDDGSPASCGGEIPFPPEFYCFNLPLGCVCVRWECETVPIFGFLVCGYRQIPCFR